MHGLIYHFKTLSVPVDLSCFETEHVVPFNIIQRLEGD